MKSVRAKLIIWSLSILIRWEKLSSGWPCVDKVYMAVEVTLSIPFQPMCRFCSNEFASGLLLRQGSHFQYLFSLLCTNLSLIIYGQMSSWFKAVLSYCRKEWCYNSPLFRLLMRMHGMGSEKLLSFKQESEKTQINSHKKKHVKNVPPS